MLAVEVVKVGVLMKMVLASEYNYRDVALAVGFAREMEYEMGV